MDHRDDVRPLRLLRSYRGYRAGEVIRATANLADYLVAQQLAQPTEDGNTLFDTRTTAERAVRTSAAENR